jgi:hypothetical protein
MTDLESALAHLKRAGILAMACQTVLNAHPLGLSARLAEMREALNEYDYHMIEAANQKARGE